MLNIPKCQVIYKLINKINKKIYVGKSKNMYNRIKSHKNSKNNFPISCAIRKYGWENFDIEIIEQFDVIDDIELLALEAAYIEYFKSINNKIGYNIYEGGSCRIGYKLSNETKSKISLSHTGKKHYLWGKHHSKENKKKMSLSHFGKKHSLETCLKISQSNKGKLPCKTTPIHQINLKTKEIINTFHSILTASQYLNINAHSNIIEVCKGKRKSAGGYGWKYVDLVKKIV